MDSRESVGNCPKLRGRPIQGWTLPLGEIDRPVAPAPQRGAFSNPPSPLSKGSP